MSSSLTLRDQENMREYGEYIRISKYARWIEGENRRETWSEAVIRYCNFAKKTLLEKNNYTLTESEYNELFNAIHSMHVMPSMRALATAGIALERENIAGYNCAYCVINRQDAFPEMLYILMNGTGMGYSVERQYVNQLPSVPALTKSTRITVVEDSKEGWTESYRDVINSLYNGEIIGWDVSKVRPQGSMLKTFGGRASGPKTLIDLFQFTISVFQRAQGRKLESIECHDLCCKIAEVVVSGGTRRSALLSLSNLSDLRMRNAKSGAWWETAPHRAFANNSIAYTEKPSMEIFMDEWVSLYKSKSGERGIYNREATTDIIKRLGRRDPNHEFGTNPCVTGDTWIATDLGFIQAVDLVGRKDFRVIVEGEAYNVESPGFVKTGTKDVYELTLDNGLSVTATADHPFLTQRGMVKLSDLIVEAQCFTPFQRHLDAAVDCIILANRQPGSGYNSFNSTYMSWEGTGGSFYDGLSADINHCIRTNENAVEAKSSDYYLGFIENVLNKYSNWNPVLKCIELYLAGYHPIFSVMQRMLMAFGIHSERGLHRLIVPESELPYICNLIHYKVDIISILKAETELPFPLRDMSLKAGIKSIIYAGVEDVYDVTVAQVHEFSANHMRVSNCSEIVLRDREFCNLSEAVIRPKDTKADLMYKVRIATILGTIQASWTNFNIVSEKWVQNCNEEALLGVSLTGIMDNPLTSVVSGELRDLLTDLRFEAIKTNAEWAAKIGIKPAAAITATKPSGSVSQLVNCASGIHARYSHYYIRTVRGSLNDPLTQFMQNAGVPWEMDVMSPNTAVFSFPIKSPPESRFRDEISAIEQLEIWLIYQMYWCEHKPSVTIMVKEHEWLDVAAWVYKHFDKISGIAFLPYDTGSYRQAPYTEITAEQYEEALDKMPKNIDWSRLKEFEKADNTSVERTWACQGDSCIYA